MDRGVVSGRQNLPPLRSVSTCAHNGPDKPFLFACFLCICVCVFVCASQHWTFLPDRHRQTVGHRPTTFGGPGAAPPALISAVTASGDCQWCSLSQKYAFWGVCIIPINKTSDTKMSPFRTGSTISAVKWLGALAATNLGVDRTFQRCAATRSYYHWNILK